MKILLLNCQGSGVGEYRHWSPARALRRRGHEVWCSEGEEHSISGEGAEEWIKAHVAWADVIHTGYSTNLGYIGLLAAARNYALQALGRSVPLIVDCDDDIINVPDYNLGFKVYAADKTARRTALWHFRNGDALTVTTPYLAHLYEPFNHHVSILPNCIDPSVWADLPLDPRRSASEDVRIMFAGGLGRKADLDSIQQAVEIVMRARPNVRLFFIAMMPDWAPQWYQSASDPLANRCFYAMAAPIPTYRRMTARLGIDIVLAPVVENDFNRGKSSLKVLEAPFMGRGAAVVCSDFETYADVPAECVLKAQTTYEWKESLLALVDDAGLRRRKVARCREWVLAERNIDTLAERWENAYEEALSRPVIGPDGQNMKGAECPSSAPPQPPSPLPTVLPPPGR